MKTRLLWSSLLLLAALLATPLLPAQDTVRSKYNQGLALYNAGKYGEALLLFEEVLAQKPDFVYARNYAAKSKSMIARGVGPKKDLEGNLARLIIPEINFADAPLGDILDYLSARAAEISGGSVVANFIYKGTPEQRQNTLITLSLRGIPLTEAIKYVSQLSHSKVKYEEHAVVIEPLQSAAAPPATGNNTGPAPDGSTFE